MSLQDAARTAVHECMALRGDESCVVVTDDERRTIGEALYAAARDVTDDAVIARYPPGAQHGEEPPGPVAGAMRESDVFLAPTTRSLSHTRARSAATDAGARGATLPGITEDVMVAGLDADYASIARECEALLAQVAGAARIRVTSDAGTDVTFEPGSRDWRSDTGINHEPGDFSNLPAGEVFVSPETADGTVVIDGTMRPHGRLETPVELTIEAGYVTAVSDDGVRAELDAAAEAAGDAAYNVAELGIGANVGVDALVGSVLLDEKAAGTVHVAVGDDASIGGDTDAPIHTDGVLRAPTVTADGEPVTLPAP